MRAKRKQSETRTATGIPGTGLNDRWIVPGLCLGLAAMVWLVFGQTVHHQFINLDDGAYVYKNPQVFRGLTSEGIIWAFTQSHAANWHPLTWLSHMLDCQLFGAGNAGAMHLVNVLFHTANSVLLFLLLRRATGSEYRSLCAAALFAFEVILGLVQRRSTDTLAHASAARLRLIDRHDRCHQVILSKK